MMKKLLTGLFLFWACAAQAQIDATRASIEQTESTLRADEANLNYAKIYAPLAGTVSVPVHRAEYQSNGMPRPGELSVQPKSICASVRVIVGAPSKLMLGQYSP